MAIPQTILYAEGDENVRRVVARALTRLGYRVLAAQTAAEALARASSEPVIDLVISELQLFGMSGVELAHEIGTLHSQAVLITANDADALSERGYGDAGHPCLAKPFNLSQLAEAVDVALGTPTRHGAALLAG